MPKNRADQHLVQVGKQPKRVMAHAIGAEDGQCASYYPGIGVRCTNEPVAFAWMEFEGDFQRVEMCKEHIRPEHRDEYRAEPLDNEIDQ